MTNALSFYIAVARMGGEEGGGRKFKNTCPWCPCVGVNVVDVGEGGVELVCGAADEDQRRLVQLDAAVEVYPCRKLLWPVL